MRESSKNLLMIDLLNSNTARRLPPHCSAPDIYVYSSSMAPKGSMRRLPVALRPSYFKDASFRVLHKSTCRHSKHTFSTPNLLDIPNELELHIIANTDYRSCTQGLSFTHHKYYFLINPFNSNDVLVADVVALRSVDPDVHCVYCRQCKPVLPQKILGWYACR